MDNTEDLEVKAEAARYCYLCYAVLDSNKACTNVDCITYGTPQE